VPVQEFVECGLVVGFDDVAEPVGDHFDDIRWGFDGASI